MVRKRILKYIKLCTKNLPGIQIYSGPEPRRSEPLPKKSSPPSGPPPSFPGHTTSDNRGIFIQSVSFAGLHPAFLHPGSSLYPSPFPTGHPLNSGHPLLGRPTVPHPSLFPSSASQHHPLFPQGEHSIQIIILLLL